MKKLLIVVCFVLGLAGMATAQTAVKKPAKSSILAPSKKVKTEAATSKAQLKADGTPDKRFKANKRNAATEVHLKKDGTPDRRFKATKKG